MKKSSHFYSIFILSALIFFSCSYEKDYKPGKWTQLDNLSEIIIPEYDFDLVHGFELNELFSEVRVVPLESTNQSRLSFPYNTLWTRDRFYIQDVDRNGLYVFHDDGRFDFRIRKQGSGPGEFHELTDFNVDADTGYITIYSRESFKFIEYNETGDFMDEEVYQLMGDRFLNRADGSRYFFKNNFINDFQSSDTTWNLSIKSGESLRKGLIPVNKDAFHWKPMNWYFFTVGDVDTLFVQPMDNRVYSLRDGRAEVKYSVHAVVNDTNYEELLAGMPGVREIRNRFEGRNLLRALDVFFESEDWIHFHFRDSKMRNALIYKPENRLMIYDGFYSRGYEGIIYPATNGLYGNQLLFSGEDDTLQNLMNQFGSCCIDSETLGWMQLADPDEVTPFFIIGTLKEAN